MAPAVVVPVHGHTVPSPIAADQIEPISRWKTTEPTLAEEVMHPRTTGFGGLSEEHFVQPAGNPAPPPLRSRSGEVTACAPSKWRT